MVNIGNFRPRTGPSIIPPGWEERHAPILASTHTATIELWSGPGNAPEWLQDPETGHDVRNHGTRLYPDRPVTARIQRLREQAETVAGGQIVTVRSYLVALDRDIAGGLSPDAHLHIVAITDDTLRGRWLQVVDVQGGSLRFERHLIALDNLG